MPLSAALVFIAVVLAISGALHAVVYLRLVTALGVTDGPALWALRALFAAGAVSFVAARVCERVAPALFAPLWWLAALWLGVFFYAFCASVLSFAVEFVALRAGAGAWLPPGPPAAAVTAAAVLALAAWGFAVAAGPAEVVDVTVPVKGLSAEAADLTIVQISDLHLGAIVGAERLARMTAQVNALRPDVLLLTGDVLDENARHLAHLAPLLGEMRANIGVYGVTGNHEYYSDAEDSVAFMRAAGVRVLRNEALELVPGLRLAGFDDPTALRFARDPDNHPAGRFEAVLTPYAGATVVMYHQPVFVERFARTGAALMLSGHTHGGQLAPFNLLVGLRYPVAAGTLRTGGLTLHVNRGTGTWGPPMRIGAPPEITRIRLVPAGG